MIIKKILIALILIMLTITAVSAIDENITSTDQLTSEESHVESSIDTTDKYLSSNNVGTFKELSKLIKNTSEDALELDKDYINIGSSYKNGITFDKSISIDGKGHTLDANYSSKIFSISENEYLNTNSIILKNIIFKNGNSNLGGAISFNGACSCTIINCTFINCHAENSGAIHFDRSYMYFDGGTGAHYGCHDCNIYNSTFIDCSASNNGGAVCFYSGENVYESLFGDYIDNLSEINNCTFINCRAQNGGAIYLYDKESQYSAPYLYELASSTNNMIDNCNFVNCNAYYGGAVYIGEDSDYNSINNSNFLNCYANMGGATYWHGSNGRIENSNFTASHATNGGGVYANEYIDLLIINSNFNNNTANKLGGAIYGGIAINCSFNENSDPEYYNSFTPKLITEEEPEINSYPISINLQKSIYGNFSIYVSHDGGNYTFIDCVNITKGYATIYYDYTKLGNYTIKAIIATNYAIYESYTQRVVKCINIYPDPELYKKEKDYYVSVNLPKDATGNFSLYISTNSKNYKLYKNINITNGKGEIKYTPKKEGEYWFKAIFNGNYGFSNATYYLKFREIHQISALNATVFYNSANTYSARFYYYENGYHAGSNMIVYIKIGSNNMKAKTDDEGFATVNIPKLKPGTYTISFKSKNVEKTFTTKLTVKHIVTLKTIKVKKSAKSITLKATLKNNKPLTRKTITFKFNGKTYKAKTNSKGIAKVTIPKSAFKRLKVGEKITYQAKYGKDIVKRTVKVQK